MPRKKTGSKAASGSTTKGNKKHHVDINHVLSPPSSLPSKQHQTKYDWKDDVIRFYREEAITAWKCFLAASMERYVYLLVIQNLLQEVEIANEILQISTSHYLTEEQKAALDKMVENDRDQLYAAMAKEENQAAKRFLYGIQDLDSGQSVTSLPPIDPKANVQHFLNLVEEGKLPIQPDTPKDDDLNLSFASSTYSEDSSSFLTARSTLDAASPRDSSSTSVSLDIDPSTNIHKTDLTNPLMQNSTTHEQGARTVRRRSEEHSLQVGETSQPSNTVTKVHRKKRQKSGPKKKTTSESSNSLSDLTTDVENNLVSLNGSLPDLTESSSVTSKAKGPQADVKGVEKPDPAKNAMESFTQKQTTHAVEAANRKLSASTSITEQTDDDIEDNEMFAMQFIKLQGTHDKLASNKKKHSDGQLEEKLSNNEPSHASRRKPSWATGGKITAAREILPAVQSVVNGIENHPEPCENQQCPGRLQFHKRKTNICTKWQAGQCKYKESADCWYAHGKSDLKKLPKLELCKKHQYGKCHLPDNQCVYAHSVSELRVDNSLQDVLLTAGSSGDQQRATKGHKKDKDTKQADRVECIICLKPLLMADSLKLDCGHSEFHWKCVTEWLDIQGNCPVCRMNVTECNK